MTNWDSDMQKINKAIRPHFRAQIVAIVSIGLLLIPALLLLTPKHFGNKHHGNTADGAITLTASKHNAGTQPTTPTTTQPTSAPASTTVTPVTAAAPVSSAAAITASAQLYVNPYSNIATQAHAYASSNPTAAAKMNRLASVPLAMWFGGWSTDVQADVAKYVSSAESAGRVPMLVAYNIPQRDCGSYSAGGANSADGYKVWLNSFAAGIGQRTAIVIVEPDALGGMDCLNSVDQQTRTQLISYAVHTLRTQTQAAVYIDGGNPTWQSTSVMAGRLKNATIAEATGFSLNVSNFQTTSANSNYGASLSSLVGGKHFVIDTSRNGNGPAIGDMNWCNPDGRAFGNTPTLQTGNPLIDGYLWIKGPGESDGSCGPTQQGTSAPAAGSWWPEYALMLANNSGW